tara:strand:- start:36 stop:467 length:432 start_codon:yes stop_codon:yes gene_type:complete
MEFKYNLSEYDIIKIRPEIKEIHTINDNRLKSAIDEFQSELNWDEMWSLDEAKSRLQSGWNLVVIEKYNKYVGWAWIWPEYKRWFNLYVHKDYRKMGYGAELIYSILNIAKDKNLDVLYADVDGWNKNSQNLFIKCGWEICQN